MVQTSFDFPFSNQYLDEEFLLSESNIKAFNFILNYNLNDKNLPKIFAIYGKKNSGKTHLSYIWQRKVNAEFLNIDDLKDYEIANNIEENNSYIIENIEKIKNQTVLFHIFNIIVEKNCNLMLTSSLDLKQIQYDFADLESRLKNIVSIKIKEPDTDFVKMLLIKQFANKQLFVEDQVIDYLAKNIDRDYEKIMQIAKLLEFYCFEEKRKITIPFVSDVLEKNKGNN